MNTPPPIIDQRYRIGDLIGKGGMGRIYKAYDLKLNERPCAIKILRTSSQSDEDRKRFQKEINLVSQLRNSHIVQILDTGTLTNDEVYLVMELLEGQTLSSLFKDTEYSFPQKEALRITRGLLVGLLEAHSLGVIHRDLKPANLFLVSTGGEGFLKILDFGIAKVISETPDQSHEPDLTKVGMIIGTPKYMAPEQFRKEPLDTRTDLYAVGLIVYEMLSGVFPYSLETSDLPLSIQELPSGVQMAWSHLNTPPPPLEVHPRLWEWVQKCLAKRPEDRHSNTQIALDELSAFMDGHDSEPMSPVNDTHSYVSPSVNFVEQTKTESNSIDEDHTDLNNDSPIGEIKKTDLTQIEQTPPVHHPSPLQTDRSPQIHSLNPTDPQYPDGVYKLNLSQEQKIQEHVDPKLSSPTIFKPLYLIWSVVILLCIVLFFLLTPNAPPPPPSQSTQTTSPRASVATALRLKLHPNKFIYHLGDLVELNVQVLDQNQTVLPQKFSFDYVSDHTFVTREENQFILKKTGRTQIQACIRNATPEICHKTELMIQP